MKNWFSDILQKKPNSRKMVYLQTGWGDSFDDVSMDEVRKAMTDLKTMDDEHDAFWVGVADDEEYILQCSKDMALVAVLPEFSSTEIKGQARSWKEVEELYHVFLQGKFEELKSKLVLS